MTNLLEWIKKPETRLKPTDLAFLDKQMVGLMEASTYIESMVFNNPLSVILVKFSDYQIQCAMINTEEADTLTALASRLENWYDAYGIRAYSIKQAYDKQGFLVSAIDGSTYAPTTLPVPEYSEIWQWDVPLSMNQLPIEIFEVM
jgi:hypothetical protein